MSTISFGFALALGVSTTEVAASDDVTPDVQNEAKVLSIELPNVPIIGDVNVSIPSKKSADAETDNAVVSVEVTDGILDEVNVAVGAETKSDEGDSKQSLASVEVKSAITNDVNIDVVSSEKSESSFDGGLVEVNAEDLPIVGETHVGVVDKHVAKQADSKSVATGLVQADIDGELLEDTSVNVIATEIEEGADRNAQQSAVANVTNDGGVLEGVVDEVTVSVLENKQAKTPDTDHSKDSIASIGLTSPITNDVNVDVGLSDVQSDETSATFDGGLVDVNAEDLPILGETHIGVMDRHTANTEDDHALSTGVVQLDVDGVLLEDTSVAVIALDTNEESNNFTSHSSVVNVSNGGGVLEGVVDEVDVTVLENHHAKNADTELSKRSIASVGLTSPLTNDAFADVGLVDLKKDEKSSTFDGGLVEVNAEDLPILGETHVGLLDKHTHSDEESSSFSTGLGQVDLDGDLIKNTAIKVLAKDGEFTEEEFVVTQGVLQTELGILENEPIPIDLITSQQIYPIADDDAVPPSIIVLAPGEEEDNTTPPAVIVPLPGDDESSTPPSIIVPFPDEDSSQENQDESITTPNENDVDAVEGSTDDQDDGNDSAFPPSVDNGSKNGNNIVQNLPTATDSPVGMESVIAAGNSNPKNDNMLNKFTGQNELPTTGGLFDSKRLAFLSLLLVAMGIVLRTFGKRLNDNTQAS